MPAAAGFPIRYWRIHNRLIEDDRVEQALKKPREARKALVVLAIPQESVLRGRAEELVARKGLIQLGELKRPPHRSRSKAISRSRFDLAAHDRPRGDGDEVMTLATPGSLDRRATIKALLADRGDLLVVSGLGSHGCRYFF
ncbi:hypothetical protein [Bradyrhizobium sp. BWA-3-5]|uniref:hypothetical protein n=1 Tax=Bradyrhizobium sp. BWA-3-5 TaxID=3080013 RepID=UPI00293E28CD|nr:hypothetical protein [Bradyrhizobium sp. BWA-3-5]WOH64120.1 hypothetical protein RX331_26445 [Bradyrhizobium sp. BWA-3-5]WOH64237.1 hypothetical protein RX331_27185 [Bradyrhizobium sp. BWA-3-5]WOH70165.1 hypothetical protein RX331_38365 [Bradyrhizobium sp. BWA-3-5]